MKIIEKIFIKKNNNYIDFNKLKNLKKRKKTLLHIGCGPRIFKNWINIDISYQDYRDYLKYYTNEFYPPEIRGNRSDLFVFNLIEKGIPLPDNSVDLIFHEDFIEHLNQKEQIIFLSESLRILKKGAIHRINTPDLISSMKNNSKFSLGKMGVYESEWDKHNHKNILSFKALREMSEMIGYKRIIKQKRDVSLSGKLLPKEYRPSYNKRQYSKNENIFVDLVK